jgi:predicted nuclease with TOPRIM domain
MVEKIGNADKENINKYLTDGEFSKEYVDAMVRLQKKQLDNGAHLQRVASVAAIFRVNNDLRQANPESNPYYDELKEKIRTELKTHYPNVVEQIDWEEYVPIGCLPKHTFFDIVRTDDDFARLNREENPSMDSADREQLKKLEEMASKWTSVFEKLQTEYQQVVKSWTEIQEHLKIMDQKFKQEYDV